MTVVKIRRVFQESSRKKRGMRWYIPTKAFAGCLVVIIICTVVSCARMSVYFHVSSYQLNHSHLSFASICVVPAGISLGSPTPIWSWGNILTWCVLLWGSLGERQMTRRLLSTLWWPVDRLKSRSRCDSQDWSTHTKAGMTWWWCSHSIQPKPPVSSSH